MPCLPSLPYLKSNNVIFFLLILAAFEISAIVGPSKPLQQLFQWPIKILSINGEK
jgi:hypothetical protein